LPLTVTLPPYPKFSSIEPVTSLLRQRIMRFLRASLLLLAALGCSHSALLTAPTSTPTVAVVGPLTLTVSDFPAMPGVLWIAPTASGARGAITATAIRYGSLCGTAVAGRSEIVGNRVTLHVTYAARDGAICTKEVRALRYDAVITGLAPGRYDVHLLHSEVGGVEAEVRAQQVDVT
jgi:hypothetical protein